MIPVNTKFLLADDDADDAQLFCEALCQIADVMKCFTVENGRKVFDFLTEHQVNKPDVIFLDINMPIMNGWDCLRKLKSHPNYSSIPAVIYSTSSAKHDVDMAYRLGASLFLSKPEDFLELQQILEIVAKNPLESLLDQLRGFKCVKMA